MDFGPKTQNNKQDVSSRDIKSRHFGDIKQQKLLIVLLIIVLLAALTGISYKVGHNRGVKAGLAKAKKTQFTNPRDFFKQSKNNLLNSNIKKGKISEIKDNEIVLDTEDGDKKTITINDKTKVTRQKDSLTLKDLKVGQKATIFTNGDKDKSTATRIVLPSEK